MTSITTPNVDWLALGPTLGMLAAAGVCLLLAVLVPPRIRKAASAWTAALGFAAAIPLAVLLYDRAEDARAVVGDAMMRDRLGAFAAVLVALAGLLTVLLSWNERFAGTWRNLPGEDRERPEEHVGEYYALLATAAAGMAFFVTASNTMTLFLGLEWFSISLYVLCAFAADREGSLEAGLKYLIVGSFGSAALLFGIALVYGATGELGFAEIARASGGLGDDPLLLAGLAMILAGLGFKASAAPFHMWTPDVYQGAPTPVTAFMSAATKVAALVVTLRLLTVAFPEHDEFWRIAVAALAVASLAIGNLAALVQRDVKRMLAYSSVAQAGFLLIPIAAGNELGGRALLLYLAVYTAMTIGAFAVVAARERELSGPVTIDGLSGLGWERPLLGVAMWVFMLGFAGLPLTGGFWTKFYAFSAAVDAGWTWLVIVGIAATAISLGYYLNVVRAIYMRQPQEVQFAPSGGAPPREAAAHLAVLVCLAITVGSFVAVEPIADLARGAVATLPF